NYPHGINSRFYENESGIIDNTRLNQDIISHIDSLSIKDRINRISYYYYKETQKAYYIFVVEGLVGDIDLTFGEVIYYSLNKRSFVDDKSKYKKYEQLQDDDTKEKFIQVAVEVDFLLPKSSLSTAIAKIE